MSTTTRRRLEVIFVCEATVGHVAFLQRLRAAASGRTELTSTWFDLHPDPEGVLERLPPFSKIWTARASLRARRQLERSRRQPDVLFFHTLAPSLLAAKWLRRYPAVISIDATPHNVDEVGAGYGHRVGPRAVEAMKTRLVSGALSKAAYIVAWSNWVRRSLELDYRIDPARIVVQTPGVPTEWFQPRLRAASKERGSRLLFVGGDFRRKGGEDLLDAFSRLPDRCELDIVTHADVSAADRIRVHRGVGPDDPRLQALYRDADIFVLPTLADTWGHAVVEAMASGLPVVTTPVGALPEIVSDGVDGLIVPPGDRAGLERALRSLVADPSLRRRLGEAARQTAVARFDSTTNLDRILDLVIAAARSAPLL